MAPDTGESQPLEAVQIDELRQHHIGRLFLQAHRSFSERSIAKLRERGHAGLGLAHTLLLPHLDLAGTRITVLAERAGITKQAMGQLANDLEAQGYVVRAIDPTDRRATLLSFTERGWQFLRDAHLIKREIEAEYIALLGEERWVALCDTLQLVVTQENAANSDSSRDRVLHSDR